MLTPTFPRCLIITGRSVYFIETEEPRHGPVWDSHREMTST